MLLNNLTLKELQDRRKEVQQFKETKLYSYFKDDLEKERLEILESSMSNMPETYGDQVEREQKFGEARQLKLTQEWFNTFLDILDQEIEHKETETK